MRIVVTGADLPIFAEFAFDREVRLLCQRILEVALDRNRIGDADERITQHSRRCKRVLHGQIVLIHE